MLRTAISAGSQLSGQLAANEFVGISSVYCQTIRWKRKPMWLGTAKTKIFRVPPRIRLPEDEAIEIKRLYNNYRTYRKTVKEYLVKLVAANEVQFDESLVQKLEDEDYEKCMKLNDKWNADVKILREKRREELMKKLEEQALDHMEVKARMKQEKLAKVEETVRKAKIDAKTFITPENIDQAIEEALQNVVSYHSAIDSQGNFHEGVYTPEAKNNSQRQVQAS